MRLAFKWAILAACVAAQGAAAQPSSRVSLGSDVVKITEVARILVSLDGGGGRVTEIEDDIVVPSALSFTESEVAQGADASAIAVRAELAGDTADHRAKRLHLVVRAAAGKTIADGSVALLQFKAPEKIEGESVDFALEHEVSVAAEGRRTDATGDRGLVTVLGGEPTVSACFFYMH